MSGDGSDKKKKFAIIGVSALILVAMVVAVAVGLTKQDGQKSEGNVSTSTKAIQAICQPTDYKETCESSLSSAAGNLTEPKELIRVGFKVAMDKIKEVIQKSNTIQDLAKDPMANQALQNCKELLEFAINDLSDSFQKLGTFDITNMDAYVADVKIWLSGAITYQQTCLDGFENTTGEAGAKMKQFLTTSQQLTSNGLAMVSEIATMFGALNIQTNTNRRLLEATNSGKVTGRKPIPAWINIRRLELADTTPQALKPDVVVAKDGTGKYKTINEALKDVPLDRSDRVFIIYVKEGVYDESVLIDKKMINVMMIGDGATKSKVTGRKNFAEGVQTFNTATFAVIGDYFIAKDMGFENTAGPEGHQAVALRVQSDLSIFYRCQMDGYQDTLYTQTHRQFYRDCTISGTIDFIFGDAAAVFQNCKTIIRKPLPNQYCMVTAQGRSDRRQPSAIILQNCTITGEPDYLPVKNTNKAYLGRPWKSFSRAIVMQSQIDDVIQPEGWTEWSGAFHHNNCWFGEFGNRGPGAEQAKRVAWRGKKVLTAQHAVDFTPGKFVLGDKWIFPSGVPYEAGMMKV